MVTVPASKPPPAPFNPTPEQLQAMNNEWIEPYDATTAPPNLTYSLYEQTVRGPGQQGSYWYVLPAGYSDPANSDTRYPVLVWLHGGMKRASQGADAALMYAEAMAAGLMPPTILVLPQALPVGWYINSIDGKYRIEDVLIQDFLPHVDATFRTNGKRGAEGFSMGGYGAAHLALKFPNLFSASSSVAPALMPRLADEPRERVWDTFRDSQEYYEKNHPIFLVKDKEHLKGANLRVRLLSGGDNPLLIDVFEQMSASLTEAGVTHVARHIEAAGHEYERILAGLEDNGAYTFWRDAFA